MKAQSLCIAAAAALAVIGLASCGENKGAANDPSKAAEVMASVTPLCMTTGPHTSSMTVSAAASEAFSGSAYYEDASSILYLKRKAVFEDYPVVLDGETYTINGTLFVAYEFTFESGSSSGAWSVGASSIYYAQGLAISGPGYERSFDADCEMAIAFTSTYESGTTTLSATATLDGTVDGRVFADAQLSLGASFQG
jgi:hypothetical protein